MIIQKIESLRKKRKMNEVDKRILKGLELALNIKETWYYLFPEEARKDKESIETFMQIFLSGFLLASMNIYDKMPKESYLELLKQDKISIYERIKIIMAYIKAKQ